MQLWVGLGIIWISSSSIADIINYFWYTYIDTTIILMPYFKKYKQNKIKHQAAVQELA